MISKKDFLEAIEKEISIAKHLAEKIPADGYEFRSTEKQRSVIELLRYLSVCGSASTHALLHESDWKLWKPYTDKSSTMSPQDFSSAMDEQFEAISKMINGIPEADFHSKMVKHPAGEEMLLGVGLMRMPFSWLVAYRMQLFLYLKQMGVAEIGTSNNWRGKDRTPS